MVMSGSWKFNDSNANGLHAHEECEYAKPNTHNDCEYAPHLILPGHDRNLKINALTKLLTCK